MLINIVAWLLVALVSLISLLLVLVFIPIRYSGHLQLSPRFSYSIIFNYAMALVSYKKSLAGDEIRVLGKKISKDRTKKGKIKHTEKTGGDRTTPLQTLYKKTKSGTGEDLKRSKIPFVSLWRDRQQLLAKLRSLIARLIKSLHLTGEATIELGMDDPGLLGMITALYDANRHLKPLTHIRFTPVFTEDEVVQGEVSLKGWVSIGQVVVIIARFALCKVVRRLWWPLWRRKAPIRKRKGGDRK